MIETPEYITELIGDYRSAKHKGRWIDAATNVEDYRHRHAITDPVSAFGVEPPGVEKHAWNHALDEAVEVLEPPMARRGMPNALILRANVVCCVKRTRNDLQGPCFARHARVWLAIRNSCPDAPRSALFSEWTSIDASCAASPVSGFKASSGSGASGVAGTGFDFAATN